jgi:hypoxanthine phosphoribosyltransferase
MKPKPNQPKKYLSWGETRQLVFNLAQRIPKNAYLWGVPRGGEIVACLLRQVRPDLNHMLHIRSLRDGPLVCCLVEDIVDSGNTVKKLLVKECNTCFVLMDCDTCECIHADRVYSLVHRTGACVPSQHALLITTDEWIVFPWEEWDGMDKSLMKRCGFTKELEAIEQGHCLSCKLPIKPERFRDDLSRREYALSGLCQTCQDKTFN